MQPDQQHHHRVDQGREVVGGERRARTGCGRAARSAGAGSSAPPAAPRPSASTRPVTTPCGTTAGRPSRCRSRSRRYSRSAISSCGLLDGVDAVAEPDDPHDVARQARAAAGRRTRRPTPPAASTTAASRRPGPAGSPRSAAPWRNPSGPVARWPVLSGRAAATRATRHAGGWRGPRGARGVPRGSVSGIRQFGYSVSVPGWFWVRRSPTRSLTLTPSSRDGVWVSSRCSASISSRSPGSSPISPRPRSSWTKVSRSWAAKPSSSSTGRVSRPRLSRSSTCSNAR